MRNRHPKGVETIVEWQQRMLAKGNDQRLFLLRQYRRTRLLRSHPGTVDRTALPPFGNRLRVDPVAGSQLSQARLTILYCSTDRLSRRGAAVKNLSHSESL